MKNMILGAVSTAALLTIMTAPAQAMSYRAKFKVTSSGSDMYMCNAGLMSQNVTQALCYKENSDGSRTPVSSDESCSSTQTNCNSRVKCTSPGGGTVYQNKLYATGADWNDHSEALKPGSPLKLIGGVSTANKFYTDATAFDKKIYDVLVELNTEVYNAKYFIDICYRAPQTENAANGVSDNYIFTNNVGSTDFLSIGTTQGDNNRTGLQMMSESESRRYTQLAGVQVQSFTVCDVQGSGSLTAGTNSSGVYNTSQNEANFTLAADGMTPTGATNGLYFASALQNIPGAGRDLLTGSLQNPRFCRVRYVFTETNALSSNPLFRDWTRKGAEMCTYTVFNDPAVAGTTTVLQ